MRPKSIRRGDVFLLKPPAGRAAMEHGATARSLASSSARGRSKVQPRPVVVVQNDFGNRYSPATIVAAVRTELRRGLPVHVALPGGWGRAPRGSIIDCALLAAMPVKALGARLARLPPSCMRRVDEALKVALSLR
ncbi:MAG: type II toxin-antitoxin system PemK/MazF family toxin [Elusimicrobia bacterium]|nr:type II toxin-antitoxin system PemK/MazF family toxin [Elusimicrobiota bacterium]